MLSPNPDNLDRFPEPVSGQPIPRGWFGRLVRFVNSLVLHGENQCFVVKHSPNGTTIAPTTALLDALFRSSGSAPAAGSGGIGFLDPSTATAHSITANTSTYVTPSDGILIATGDGSLSGDYSDSAECWVDLIKNSTSINRIEILYLSPNLGSNPATTAHTRSSICIPVAAGVTISPCWGTNGYASASITATFYT